jgi:type I restriction enzyme M protein
MAIFFKYHLWLEFRKGKKQNFLDDDINKIIDTYQYRKEETRFSRAVSLEEIEQNDFNLNISRYVSTAKPEEIIDLKKVNNDLKAYEKDIKKYTDEHNKYLKELGLDILP